MLKIYHKTMALFFIISICCTANAIALTINHGTKIIAVDGNNDNNATVLLALCNARDDYYLKYSVNNSDWLDITNFVFDTLTGGDIIDFALAGSGNCNTNDNEFYILSNDLNDDNFSATMFFKGDIDGFKAQQPQISTSYFKYLVIEWDVLAYNKAIYSISATPWCGEGTNNDGIAPVPEPATMILFGTGLIGIAGFTRKKMNLKAPRD